MLYVPNIIIKITVVNNFLYFTVRVVEGIQTQARRLECHSDSKMK